MLHSIALFAGLASLGLISALYYVNVYSRQNSWLRAELVAMMLLAFLTGMFPIAAVACIVGLWSLVSGGLSGAAIAAAGADIAAIVAVVLTMGVFRALVIETYRPKGDTATVTPLTPRPTAPRGGHKGIKIAA